MADAVPSRSAILELRDERQAMVEGHAFLDEKCLAIAAEIVRELARYLALEAEFLRASRDAARTLQAALARHGLAELNLHPVPDVAAVSLAMRTRPVMGVKIATAPCRDRVPPVPRMGLAEASACPPPSPACFGLAPQVVRARATSSDSRRNTAARSAGTGARRRPHPGGGRELAAMSRGWRTS